MVRRGAARVDALIHAIDAAHTCFADLCGTIPRAGNLLAAMSRTTISRILQHLYAEPIRFPPRTARTEA